MDYEVTLPKLGESIVSATIVRWFKKEGDTVHLDEPLLEVSTDKVNSEIPSPASGILTKIVAHPDQEFQVGDRLAIITPSSTEKHPFYSPAVLRMVAEHNLSQTELAHIPATGEGGRVSKKDLEMYLEKNQQSTDDIDSIPMTGMRKAIADNMVRSFYQAPHATLISEIDVTHTLAFIQQNKEPFFTQYGVKLTITSLIAQAIVASLAEYPLLNSSLKNDKIVIKRFINLGIAVSVEQGLLVPVIKNAHTLQLPKIAQTLQDLSHRARNGKLQPQEVQDGTITLSNFGISGITLGIPIIRYPEVAILGVGAIQKKALPIDDTIQIRSTLHLSLTFDHRVIDGMYGCAYLNAVKNRLHLL